MSETLILSLFAFIICLAIYGLDLLRPRPTLLQPGLPKRSTSGMFTTLALFGVISGWAIPHMISEYGLPAGYGALMIVGMTIVITLISKRLWVLARRYQTRSQVTLVRMYFRDDALAGVVSVLNGATCVVLTAMIFHLIGSVASHVTGLGIIGFYIGITGIALAGYLVCTTRDRNTASRADVISFGVYIIGMVGLGLLVLNQFGGFDGLGIAIEQHVSTVAKFPSTEGHGGGDFPALLAIPGVYQNVMNVQGDFYVGGPWTGLMILSASLCAIGMCVSQIGFVQMTEASDTRKFSGDHIVRYAFVGGGLAVVFAIPAGLGVILGVDINLLKIMAGESLAVSGTVARVGFSIFGFVIFASCLSMLFTAFGIPIERDGNAPKPSWVKILMLALFAGLLAFTPLLQLIDYVTLLMALSAQLLPLVFGLCWAPWLTRRGAFAGLIGGMIAVLLTDFPGVLIQHALIGNQVWGTSPFTMHAAGWGLIFNVLITVVISAATQSAEARTHRATFHDVLQSHASIGDEARGLIPVAWVFTVSWFLFALGPGAVIGNSIFGAPDQPIAGWNFSIPSIWAWQMFMWVMGVALVWFLASRLGVSHPVEGTVKPVTEENKSN